MTELLLGIDVGTMSTKGVLARPDGTVVARTVRHHGLSTPRPGWAEHDAESIWDAEAVSIAQELSGAAEGAVTAVGVSGIGPCLLPVDGAGRPLRPAILYGIDTRAEQEIAELTERYGADTVLDRCGSPLTSQAVGPKLLWLRRREPEIWRRTRRMLMASSRLVLRLTGEYVLDHHSASQCVPMYDSRKLAWIPEWTDEISPGLELPRLAWPAEIAGRVTAEAAALTGIPAGIPVTTGTIDAWAEACSVGVIDPGDVMVMYGTTMFLIAVQENRRTRPTLWSTVGAFPGSHTLAAGMATSGAITDWLREVTGQSFTDLTAAAAAAPPGAEGLVMLPYFAGERTPLFDPRARGVIAGLTLRHGRGHLYRAALEATAYGVRHNLEAMRAAGGEPKRLVTVGGGVQGGLWTQTVSNVLQQPQLCPRQTIGASYGDALLAGMAVGLVEDPRHWNPIESTIEPDPATAPLYEKLYSLYRQLYPATAEVAHALAGLGEFPAA